MDLRRIPPRNLLRKRDTIKHVTASVRGHYAFSRLALLVEKLRGDGRMYPSQTVVLDELFSRLSRDGRGRVLFGVEDLSPYEDAIMACCLGRALPEYYFEFPLAGTPWLDMLVLYDRKTLLKSGSFEGPDPHGYKRVFERFAKGGSDFELKSKKSLCMGTELDLSRDAGKSAGFYLSGARNERLVRDSLTMLGEEGRIVLALDVINHAPSFWKPYYLGVMPAREDAPVRLGFTVMSDDVVRYANEADAFAEHLEALGFSAFSSNMLDLIAKTAGLGLTWDIQVDVLRDGSLGPVLGLSWALESVRIQDARESFSHGSMRSLMRLLEKAGLSDDRWERIPDAFFVDKLFYAEDDKIKTLGLIGRANFAKVKWKEGVAQVAKYYLVAKGFDVD